MIVVALNQQHNIFNHNNNNSLCQPTIKMLQSPFNDRVEGSRSTAAGKRPKLSLASLIGQAILAAEGQKARLSTIYEWISDRYPEYYRMNCGGWQNSIRHNLTINKAFVRLPKDDCDIPGKGAFWTIHPDFLHQFKDGVFTGKIRGADYRALQKQRSKRNSLTDLQSFGHPERISYYHLESELSHSANSLATDNRPQAPEEFQAAHDEFGYHGPPPIPQGRTSFAIPHAQPTTTTVISQYPYFPPPQTTHVLYSVMPPALWQPSITVEQHHDANCECAYCTPIQQQVSSFSHHTETLPSIMESQIPSMPLSYHNITPQPAFQPFYNSSVAAESDELAMAHIQTRQPMKNLSSNCNGVVFE